MWINGFISPVPEQLINAFLVVLTKEESLFKDITANRNLGGQALSVPTH